MPVQEINTKGTTGKVEANSRDSEAVQEHWFYAVMSPPGVISKGGAESSAAFSEMLGSATIGWVDYVSQEADFDKEALTVAAQLGFSNELVSSLADGSYLSYQDFDTEMGMKLPSVQVRQLKVEPYPLLLFLRKNFILTIHPLTVDRRFMRLRRYAETVLKKIPTDANAEDKLTMLLMRIIDHNNDRNFEHLRQIEELGDELSENLTDYSVPRTELAPKIYQMKHALIVYLNALWDTVDVLHTLRYGDAKLITDDPKLEEKLGLLAEDVNRQIGLAEHMSEVLASGLEALQSIYNNQLQSVNNRLSYVITYLTILGTAILVPNTLATILSNPVFDIGPKDQIWYWPLMIGATALATFLVYWWVRKRGLIPKKMD